MMKKMHVKYKETSKSNQIVPVKLLPQKEP